MEIDRALRGVDRTTSERLINCTIDASPELVIKIIERFCNLSDKDTQKHFLSTPCESDLDFGQKFLDFLRGRLDLLGSSGKAYVKILPFVTAPDEAINFAVYHNQEKPDEYRISLGPHGISCPQATKAVIEFRKELLGKLTGG